MQIDNGVNCKVNYKGASPKLETIETLLHVVNIYFNYLCMMDSLITYNLYNIIPQFTIPHFVPQLEGHRMFTQTNDDPFRKNSLYFCHELH